MRADLLSAMIAWGGVAREAVARAAEAREAEGEEEEEAVAVVAPGYTLDALRIPPRMCLRCCCACKPGARRVFRSSVVVRTQSGARRAHFL